MGLRKSLSWKLLHSPGLDRNETSAVAFSPDGELLATAHRDGAVRFWSPATGGLVGAPLHHESPVHALSFSPDGTTLAAVTLVSNTTWLWSVKSRKPSGRPIHSEGMSWRLGFSPDGKVLAMIHKMEGRSGSVAIRLYSVATGGPVGQPL